MAKVTFTGINQLRRALDMAGPLATKALESAMMLEQEAIIAAAKERTPVDTGTLRGSGTVLAPEVSGTQVTVESGFGGAAADYAIPVHERLGVHHPVGEAKFLERSFLERAPRIPANLARRVEAAWQRLRVR